MYVTHHLSFQDQLHSLNPIAHTHTKKKKRKKKKPSPKPKTHKVVATKAPTSVLPTDCANF